MLLDQFISQTGKQPADWTTQDIQNYLDHVKAHIAEITSSRSGDCRTLPARERPENPHGSGAPRDRESLKAE